MKKQLRGFTLIELLIVVTIISILAAIALPAYDGYVRRGNRTIAKTTLVEVASRQESFFNDRKQFATALNLLDPTMYSAATVYVSKSGNISAGSTGAIYSVTLSAATASSFTAMATAMGAQKKDTGCTTLTINNLGQKTPASGDCWSR